MARLTKLIKTFEFPESNRNKLSLGSGTRLNINTNRIQLKEAAGYSTSTNNVVATWTARPTSVKKWLGFEVKAFQKKNDNRELVTSCRYRLNDGLNQYYWDGSNWGISTTLWNTASEIADAIVDFSVTNRGIGVVINLLTSDPRYTPEVESIKVLYEARIDFQLDILARSLIPALKQGVRPLGDVIINISSATNSIVVPNPIARTPYNLIGIDSVYNHTLDPLHLEDLFSSYNPTNRTVTLNEQISSGQKAFVRFIYEPEVALSTGRTYSEVSKVPSLLITDLKLSRTSKDANSDDEVINPNTGKGWRVRNPTYNDIDFSIQISTDKSSDQHRIADELKKFFKENTQIKSVGMDETYRMWLWDDYIGEGQTAPEDIMGGKIRARICQVAFFDLPSVEVSVVKRIVVSGQGNIRVTYPRARGNRRIGSPPAVFPLEIEQGLPLSIPFELFAPDGVTPLNISGQTIRAQIRVARLDPAIVATFDPFITNGPMGQFSIVLNDSITDSIPTGNSYVWDLEIEDLGGNVTQLRQGTVVVTSSEAPIGGETYQAPTLRDLPIYQGASFNVPFQAINTSNGQPLDIGGYLIRARIKKTRLSTVVVETFTTNITNGSLGLFAISLTDEQTAAIACGERYDDAGSIYVWDLEIESPTGFVTQLYQGTVYVYAQVTR